MKKTLIMILLLAGIFSVRAQDEKTYTDEELETYATVMVWAEIETENLKNIVRDSVETWLEGEELTNNKYNELSKADKAGNLDEVDATEEEIATYKEIQEKIETKKQTFKEEYIAKIKEDIGAGLYNSLKKDLKSNEDVAVRYQEIYVKLSEEARSEGDSEEAEADTTAGSK